MANAVRKLTAFYRRQFLRVAYVNERDARITMREIGVQPFVARRELQRDNVPQVLFELVRAKSDTFDAIENEIRKLCILERFRRWENENGASKVLEIGSLAGKFRHRYRKRCENENVLT